ncbi:hypothetical protein CGLO_13738 [Colletotrichum gloeosporioides Cg-14]|uniref:Uncharacterized protein n=1 Tax=Colletotrichum gloeosporioides (strain Cg-14) TaxID=1237896 RepID=T0K320_COLGC|nr:hypothetical protein CGLO_13738 [Colletotrichum gloeosporioides Cg-14]
MKKTGKQFQAMLDVKGSLSQDGFLKKRM